MEQRGLGPEEKAARDVERVLAGLPGLAAAVELAVRVLDPDQRAIVRRGVQEHSPGRSARDGGPGPLLALAVGMGPDHARPADHPRSLDHSRHRRPR